MSATSQPGRHVSVITWAHLYVTRQSLLGSVYNRPSTFALLCIFFSPAAGLCRSHRLSNWSYDGLQGDGMMLHQHDTFRLAYTTIGLVGTARPPRKVRHILQRLQLFSGMLLAPPRMGQTPFPSKEKKENRIWSGLDLFPSAGPKGFGLLPKLAAIRDSVDQRCAPMIVFPCDRWLPT